MSEPLDGLTVGMPIVFGGNRVARVSAELAADFRRGDQLVVVQTTGDLLHVRSVDQAIVNTAVHAASAAFAELASVDDAAVTAFFDRFAAVFESDELFEPIARANDADVASAQARGRSTTRLELGRKMRADMAAALRLWRDVAPMRDGVIERVEHEGWSVEQRRAGLGVVGFVFEGRPNVFADATGLLRSGNTAVFRIGSDALGTARAIMHHVQRLLGECGLPMGAVQLLDSPSRATGWALFSHKSLSLAVARGSGEAVEQLGAVARQAGVPVSLHGTGGAWLITGRAASPDDFESAVFHSLDRKVCNTLNVCCILRERQAELMPRFMTALQRAGDRRGLGTKLHTLGVIDGTGDAEPFADMALLGHEWEWDDVPEVTLAIVDSVDAGVAYFNAYAPRLVASLVSSDPGEHESFYRGVDAPFVGNGFTRWVDGQFALNRPELGLSNWANGRLFGRSGVLSGDSVFTVRTVAHQTDPDLHR